MDAVRSAYRGDAELERLLQGAGIDRSVAEIRDLIAGVNAAPDGEHPDRWLALVGEDLPAELATQLRLLRRSIPHPAAPEAGDHAARLAALRAELHRRGLDGFVIPRGDEHQGEYVPLRANRLAWLTGFTGSAGMALVLKEKAAIFIDGRYTLQVRQEVDNATYEYRHLIDEFHGDWAAGLLRTGQKLGFDPWLHTVGWVERMRNALARCGAELIAVDDNPIDTVWHDQPPAPLGLVTAHPERYAGKSAADKRAEVARELERSGTRAAVLTQPDSIAWLLNVRGSDVPCTPLPLSFALARDSGEVDWFVDRRKLAPGLEEHLGNQVAVRPPEELGDELDALGKAGAKVRVDPGNSAVWIFDRLHVTGGRVEREADPCILPKACKNPVEIAGARAAHVRDGVAMARFLCWLEQEAPAGRLDEIAAAQRLLAFRREGELFQDQSFETISAAGPNAALCHYRVSEKTNRRIENNSLYLVDSGAQYLDGTTDITRTVAVGEPTAEMKRLFTLVLKGHIAISTVRFPGGTTGSQLDALARQYLWAEGLDYDHGTGHGVGSFLSVHEGPQRIAKMHNPQPLLPGMILSNEPGYYRTGGFGIRTETLVLVTALEVPGAERPVLGFETLTLAPIDRRLVEPSLLTPAERDWLNGYHARVRQEIGPRLDDATRGWLERATEPV
ncbi:aminopeptidase P family protein [Rhodospirillum centenum]|uniref:Xaa-Pro aminopeptidase, putative n=1 Tax=Rhodospirillum centenum (strain ATCC 51521 / SW) TaxID=414684 RepID=B6IP06_RHOCS|nr:aminopeptidase P family protein [Rhodospirillum centenum]ACI99426.1 Xaa-Pro aminopeptidase, putative [Rhodospirillum centenum SW]